MKQQLLFVHGGQAFNNYEAFLTHLRTKLVPDPFEEPPKRWKYTLPDALGDRYELFFPSMPNRENARYTEWKIWFERYVEFLRDDVVLIGHSQGGYFLSKYLSEERMPVCIKALYLIAAPIEPDNFGGEDGGDFAVDQTKLVSLEKHIGEIYIYHSKDDQIVPYTHAQKYKELLPHAHLTTFKDRGHFLDETFPELIESIQALQF